MGERAISRQSRPPVNAVLLIIDTEMSEAFIMLQGQDGRCTGLMPDAVEIRFAHGAAANEEVFPDLVPVQGPDPHIPENHVSMANNRLSSEHGHLASLVAENNLPYSTLP